MELDIRYLFRSYRDFTKLFQILQKFFANFANFRKLPNKIKSNPFLTTSVY